MAIFKQAANRPQGQSQLRVVSRLPHKFVRDSNGKVALLIRNSPRITKQTKTATYFTPESIMLKLYVANKGFDYSVLDGSVR